MYCTGGFFHAAEKAITKDGQIIDLNEGREDAIFTFEPIEMKCDRNGFVKWSITEKATNRYIFKINDISMYRAAMTNAMKSLLMRLP